MKKILFSFLSLMGFPAFAQSHINIELLGATYTTPAVQFRVSWNSIPSIAGETHNSKIWLWVDYIKIENNQPSGTWTRATIANPSPGTMAPETNKGFWLQGNNGSYNQIVTVELNIPANTTFNWCAYASDYPPNATMASGTYTLKGSPPFKITYNGSSYTETNNKSFTVGCIASITDATDCPGIINYPAFSAGALGNGSWGAMGEFLNVGGTPLTIVSATAASGGSGKITYKWFKNNTEISGATAATHLPPKADASATGTFNYTRKAYDGVCHTAGATASGTWINVVSPTIHTYTGCSIYVARYDITTKRTWENAVAACQDLGSGWRLPTSAEANACLGPYRNQFGFCASITNCRMFWWTNDYTLPWNECNRCTGIDSHDYMEVNNYDAPETACRGACIGSAVGCGCCLTDLLSVRCVKNK
jgi:hypothetical protein